MIQRDALTLPHWRKCEHDPANRTGNRCNQCRALVFDRASGRRGIRKGNLSAIHGVGIALASVNPYLAMEPPEAVKSAPVQSCPKGHPKTPDNVYYIEGRGHSRRKYCLTCRREMVAATA